MVRVDLSFLLGLWQIEGHAGWIIQVSTCQSRERCHVKDSPGPASTWKRRRAEYLLHAERLEEIRAEGLEQHLSFEPGDLTDIVAFAQRASRSHGRNIGTANGKRKSSQAHAGGNERVSKAKPRKKRPNPAFGLPGLHKMLADTAGNLLVTSALQGATFEEKVLIGSLLPAILKLIRANVDTSATLDKLFPDGLQLDIDGIGQLQRPPGATKE
jgi:hypothetical protein